MSTTIQVSEKVKEKLEKLKSNQRETYNDIIIKLIDTTPIKRVDNETLSESLEIISNPQLMKDIAQAIEDYEKGFGIEFSKLKKDVDLNV